MSTKSPSVQSQLIGALLTPQVLSIIINTLLAIIEEVSSSAALDAIIKQIQAFLPAIIQLAPELVSDVQSIITSLTQKTGLTDVQMAALLAAKTALDTQTDADIAAALAYANS